MALTDTLIRQAKPAATPIKLTDEKGLHLLINPNGSRYWRFNYRINGKQKTLALGTYPDTSLKMARIFRDEARQLIANGTDPAELRKSEKVAVTEARREQSEADMIERMIQAGEPLPDSFEAVAREWFTKQELRWAATHANKIRGWLQNDVFPYLALENISKKWTMPIRDWKAALNRFTIQFEDRMPQH